LKEEEGKRVEDRFGAIFIAGDIDQKNVGGGRHRGSQKRREQFIEAVMPRLVEEKGNALEKILHYVYRFPEKKSKKDGGRFCLLRPLHGGKGRDVDHKSFCAGGA